MIEIGSIVDGKYKILNEIGRGGMSVVYLAMNERANKQWAIKEINKGGTQDYDTVKQNLIVETDMLKKFNHPNLPSIVDVIDNGDTFLIVMDYIEGISLKEALKRNGAQRQEDVIEWSKQLCDVLGYLHSRRPPIIYRDMKPANVMLKPDGNVMVIDFGTAREFKESKAGDTTCLGTIGYAAPEQFGGQGQTDPRTDIYNLGATMYHLVTGHDPSVKPYEMFPIRQWDPKLSSGLEEIIWKCTQKNPDDRYQSCAELLYALDHYTDLDIENKKVQNFKWKTFLATTITTAVMLLLTVIFSIVLNVQTASTYEAYIQKAVETSKNDKQDELKEKYHNYKEAIKLDPSRPEAYIYFWTYCINGEKTLDETKAYHTEFEEWSTAMKVVEEPRDTSPVLSREEFNCMKELLRESGDKLKDKYPEYYADLLIYPMANSLFFYSTQSTGISESEGRKLAKPYYEEVVSVTKNKDIKQQAELMKKFSNIYIQNKSLQENREGRDDNSGYRDYWGQLIELCEDTQNTLNETSPALALDIYRTVMNLMYRDIILFETQVDLGVMSEQTTTIYNYAKEARDRAEKVYKSGTYKSKQAKEAYDTFKNTCETGVQSKITKDIKNEEKKQQGSTT